MTHAVRPRVIVVGAGAAGLATAIFTARMSPRLDVLVLDGAAKPGAKILVSGGTRCNVTNAVVTDRDYWGGKRTVIRRVLARLPVPDTIAFFRDIGVPLKEEPSAKLFPVSDRSRDVLDALLGAARAAGVELRPATRVHDARREGERFIVETARGPMEADAVVLATGGLSLPKTGSDGGGLEIARRLGHTIVPTTPALAPLVAGEDGIHRALAGVTQDVELALFARPGGRLVERIRGAIVWTHFGISGPAALDMSRHLLRARLEGEDGALTMNLRPGATFEETEAAWVRAAQDRPRASVVTVLAETIPASVAESLVLASGIDVQQRLAHLSRDHRRRLAHATVGLPLPITGSRGYNYAEATAGGVTLDDVDPRTLESRKVRRLYLAGEMLDVDGRLGGFNFQWAWSSGKTVAEAVAREWTA